MTTSIYYKTQQEIEEIKKSAMLVSKTLAEVALYIEEGKTGLQIDKIAEEFINDNGGIPAFKGYKGFKHTLCISPNNAVVHGIPTDIPFQNGDIISVDCGALLNGFFGDSAYTFIIGDTKEEIKHLLSTTKMSLQKGIEKAIIGNRIGDISAAIQEEAQSNNYGVVRELIGHGIGRELHEPPEVPNFGRKGTGIALKEGLVIAIEPMINMGKKNIRQTKDGWTILTQDGLPSAHFEHTIAIQQEKPCILSSFDIIENALKQTNKIYV